MIAPHELEAHASGQHLPATGECDWCGAEIAWAMTRTGHRRMPLDPTRYADDEARANVLVSGDHLGSIYARVESAAEPRRPEESRYLPHFATCTRPRRPRRPYRVSRRLRHP
jgi:hypothetical protein